MKPPQTEYECPPRSATSDAFGHVQLAGRGHDLAQPAQLFSDDHLVDAVRHGDRPDGLRGPGNPADLLGFHQRLRARGNIDQPIFHPALGQCPDAHCDLLQSVLLTETFLLFVAMWNFSL